MIAGLPTMKTREGARRMNLIVLFRGASQVRHVAVPLPTLAGLFASGVLVLLGSFGLGYGLARSQAPAAGSAHIATMQEQIAAQQAEVASARHMAQGYVAALAVRLGELNAHVIRLNALGSRLAAMARLDDGEFDFSDKPAMGGPDEPESVAVEGSLLTADLDDLAARLERQDRQLALLAGLLVDRKLSEAIKPRGWPVRSGYISSYFGRRADPFTGQPRHHRGIDFAARAGSEVVAVAAGVVTWTGYRQGYGRMVEITHGNGYVTRYAHNARNLVGVGDEVRQGDAIALVGASGRATGSNLHFEVWHDGRPVDPGRYIRSST